MNRLSNLFLALCCMVFSLPVMAANIESDDVAAILELKGLSPKDKRLITAPLFDFSPFSANQKTVVPGFADPLGAGIDPNLRIFSGKVHFMDVLGNFRAHQPAQTTEVELPESSLKGINLLDDFLAVYLSYDGRAFDPSMLNLAGTRVVERGGLPVTSEASPLTLAGYGSVSENLRPIMLHWTRCPSRDKRLKTIRKSISLNQWPCPSPGACQCYAI